jgi:hypothetical protein
MGLVMAVVGGTLVLFGGMLWQTHWVALAAVGGLILGMLAAKADS